MWRVGMALAVVSLPLSQFTDSARAFQLHVAFALPALCCVYWLFSRFSRMDAKWSRDSLRICATLFVISGGVIAFGRVGIPQPLAAIAAPLVLLAQIIIASHWHKAIANRDANATLSPHWLALATLLLVVNGIIGALSIQPGVQAAMRGADMARAQDWAGGPWRCYAWRLRWSIRRRASCAGDNRRVTGYMAFWLVGFGGILAAVCQMGTRHFAILSRRAGHERNPDADDGAVDRLPGHLRRGHGHLCAGIPRPPAANPHPQSRRTRQSRLVVGAFMGRTEGVSPAVRAATRHADVHAPPQPASAASMS